MKWCYEKIIQELRKVRSWNYQPKEDDIRKIRLFASKYFKDTWRQELSQFDYDVEQLREFRDFIDWEKWYYWKGKSVKWYILTEFKDRCKSMREDYEKFEKQYGVNFMRSWHRKWLN